MMLTEWISTCKRMKVDPYLTSYAKINSKWVKHLNRRVKIVKLLEEKHRCKSWIRQWLLGYDTESRVTKFKIDKEDIIF